MKSVLEKLTLDLNECGNEAKVESVEVSIAESIEDAIEEELFFSLPTNEIVKIIQKSNIYDAEMYSNIIVRMCEAKGGEAALIINVVKAEDTTFEECVSDLVIVMQKMKGSQKKTTNIYIKRRRN